MTGLFILTILFGNVTDCMHIGFWQWICVVVSGIIGLALGHVLYYVAIQRIGATIPSLVILAQPFIVLAISYFIFAESLNFIQLLFGAVLLAGSALAIWAQQYLKKI